MVTDEKFDETGHLRSRLRSEWPAMAFGELVWVESARGGTVGAPDVFLPLGAERGYLPVELKAWEGKSGVKMTAGASQRRFHILAALAGQRTAFLAVLQDGTVVTITGKNFGNVKKMKVVVGALSVLRSLYKDEEFWK